MERYSEFTIIIAEQGRGKTTQLINFIKKRLNKGHRALVIVPDLNEPAWFNYPAINGEDLEEDFDPNFTGVLVVEYDEDITFDFLYDQFKYKGLRDLIFVLDDPGYIEEVMDRKLKYILSRRRQLKIDIFSNSHSYDNVPPKFFPYITIWGLGHTQTEIVNRRKHLGGDYLKHVKRRNQVNNATGVDKSQKEYYNFFYIDRQCKLLTREELNKRTL